MRANPAPADASPVPPVAIRDVAIAATDGTPLAATLFEAARGDPGSALVVIAPGAAIPRRFYTRFATYLAERGHAALTFDYRDTGGSRRGPLPGSPTRMRWPGRAAPGPAGRFAGSATAWAALPPVSPPIRI